MAETANPTALLCTHCGAPAGNDPIISEDKVFCCRGCASVYSILNENGLCDYYQVSAHAGVSPDYNIEQQGWSTEELDLMAGHFTLYSDERMVTVLLHIPAMHCSSCIWLLEKLSHLDKGILGSRTDFVSKQLRVTYDPAKTGFGKLVILLRSLGYEPSLMPEEERSDEKRESRGVLIRLGVAGFCAGNIMLFSFPQYLGLEPGTRDEFGRLFDGINAALSVPLIFYCAAAYFKSFGQWISKGAMSVKVPLALGIGALWLRSIYEVATATGPGYFDSLAGLVFFLLIGTWLQNTTFDALRFGEKARHFFPLVARVIRNGNSSAKKVVDLVPGDRVEIRQGEIIPADGILMGSEAWIDYAFATGESTPVHKVAGEMLFGGGKNTADRFEMEIIRSFDQGKLTEIWKSAEGDVRDSRKTLSFEARISAAFIWVTISLAMGVLIYWLPRNSQTAWFSFVAVLMVACPCALALAPPFAYNIISNKLASLGLFVRKPDVVGILGDTRALVFDKTGTLTDGSSADVIIPASMNNNERAILLALTMQSNHPYSRVIAAALNSENPDLPREEIIGFREFQGKGVEAVVNHKKARLGSRNWVCGKPDQTAGVKAVWMSIDDRETEPVIIENHYREGLSEALAGLRNHGVQMVLASGDVDAEKNRLEQQFPGVFSAMYFEQSPAMKVQVVKQLRDTGTVIMVGDGLNDAGALKAGDAGMVITRDTNNFTPEASAILLADHMDRLPGMLDMARTGNRIVKETFAVSLIYNVAALSVAATGNMNPLLAAIIMPASSMALMLYAWARTRYMVSRRKIA